MPVAFNLQSSLRTCRTGRGAEQGGGGGGGGVNGGGGGQGHNKSPLSMVYLKHLFTYTTTTASPALW